MVSCVTHTLSCRAVLYSLILCQTPVSICCYNIALSPSSIIVHGFICCVAWGGLPHVVSAPHLASPTGRGVAVAWPPPLGLPRGCRYCDCVFCLGDLRGGGPPSPLLPGAPCACLALTRLVGWPPTSADWWLGHLEPGGCASCHLLSWADPLCMNMSKSTIGTEKQQAALCPREAGT